MCEIKEQQMMLQTFFSCKVIRMTAYKKIWFGEYVCSWKI
jgi:hypothetical protein